MSGAPTGTLRDKLVERNLVPPGRGGEPGTIFSGNNGFSGSPGFMKPKQLPGFSKAEPSHFGLGPVMPQIGDFKVIVKKNSKLLKA